ncbi:MAG: hypothetical protein P9X24_03430 [Candidatus Hatepunaea meridiana]|nr:hypothetical protein [Candidatus Hatepunaea meridiana]
MNNKFCNRGQPRALCQVLTPDTTLKSLLRMTMTTVAVAIFSVLMLGPFSSLLARRGDAGPVRDKGAPARTDAAGTKDRFMHDVGNVRMTLTNWGEQGNPDQLAGYFGFEFPAGSENDFLFSSGIWVGAIKSGQRLVSTGTDGDDGTNEFAPSFDSYIATSKQYAELAGKTYIMGAKEIDDDGDWDIATDDLDGNEKPSPDWDGGGGFIGHDDDGDGVIDEEEANGEDDDGDGLIDEDTWDGDDNGDGNCKYDPEPHIDEDPAGDISHDFIDNDFDGYVDMDDEYPPDDPSKWYDGDAVPGSNDDDGDGLEDEDGVARGTQEFFCVYDDCDAGAAVTPDPDGHTPLNVMVLQRTYAWGEAYAGSFILVDLIVRNVGEVPLTDVHIGLFADPDVAAKGESGDDASVDDWNFYDSENLMMIQGDDSTDSDGFGPGIFAMKIVRSPAPLEELDIVFKNFDRVSGGDPELNSDKFDMISDDPANNSGPTGELGDWRYLMGFAPRVGSWTLMPGDELPVTVAFIAGIDVADVQKNAQWAQRIYDNDFRGPAAPDQPVFSLEAYPDHIRVHWEDNSESSVDPITQIEDFEGYVIQRSSDTNYWWTMKQYDIINRLPTPEFERENLNLGMPYDETPYPGVNWDWRTDANGDTVGRNYWYDDYDVLRGWTYYYIVQAFDQGIVGAGVLITPIGQSYLGATAGYTEATSTIGTSVDEVFVVPNPYKGSHEQEYSGAMNEADVKYYPRKLWFMNLPAGGADIDIYTIAGDHIVNLEHPAGNDIYLWDMRNKYHQEIVSGIYYYVVESEAGNIKIDKFVVLK